MRFDALRLPRALELLSSAVGTIRAKAGCSACHVSNDLTEVGPILYFEEWESAAAFRRHVQSDEFWRVLVAMDLCAEPPEVTICELSAIRGMDYLRQLRGPASPAPGGRTADADAGE